MERLARHRQASHLCRRAPHHLGDPNAVRRQTVLRQRPGAVGFEHPRFLSWVPTAMGLPPTQQLLSTGSHRWPAMGLQDDSTKSVLSSPNIKIGVITERLPSRHCKHLIQTCNPDTTSFSNFRSRSQTTLFDSWNSELSIAFSRSTPDDNTLIPRLHAEAL